MSNDAIQQYLSKMVSKGHLGKPLLFAGPDSADKRLAAETFAANILGSKSLVKSHPHSHPDLHIYKPTGKLGMHPIDTMHQLSRDVYMSPHEGKWKVFIIHDVHRMLPSSANAMLKTFEEPPPDTVFILLSSNYRMVLPTILSRCCVLHFAPAEKEKDVIHKKEVTPKQQRLLQLLSIGRLQGYGDLLQGTREIEKSLDEEKVEVEKAARGEVGKLSELTALQREALEKEIEGLVAGHASQEVNSLLETVLTWYRDLHLLKDEADPHHLIHKEYQPQLLEVLGKVFARTALPSLEQVQKALSEARLAYERFINPSACLETLFLRLNLL